MRILGIDPGKKGSFCLLNTNSIGNISSVKIWEMMEDEKSTIRYLSEMCLVSKLQVYLEQISAGAFHKGDNQAGKHANHAKLLANFTLIKTTFQVKEQPFSIVHPRTWQKYHGLRGLEKKTRKREHCLKAKTLFPETHITQETCDSVLIAEYGRKQIFNKPGIRK